MADIDRFFDEIDINRSRRVRELAEIKRQFSLMNDKMGIASKSVVVLSYAHWEGFYNDCVRVYAHFLRERGGRVRDADWMMLTGVMGPELQTLMDRRHSHEARRSFVSSLRGIIDCEYRMFKEDVVLSRSNLNFQTISGNYQILSFDLGDLQPHRLRLDRELVSWRHQVAHGDQPDLSKMDIAQHVELAATLLLLVADHFQQGMLTRLP